MIRRLCLALAASGAIFAGAGVVLVALAFALYALVLPRLGPAGAAAAVAAAAAIIIALAGLGIGLAARPPRSRKPRGGGFVERLVAFVQEQPVLAIAASVATGFMAVRNPAYLGQALRAFLDERPR